MDQPQKRFVLSYHISAVFAKDLIVLLTRLERLGFNYWYFKQSRLENP